LFTGESEEETYQVREKTRETAQRRERAGKCPYFSQLRLRPKQTMLKGNTYRKRCGGDWRRRRRRRRGEKWEKLFTFIDVRAVAQRW
jgi:hypothetical protein